MPASSRSGGNGNAYRHGCYTTEDLVGPAVFLASDASNFVNGHVLYVDGGILAYIGKQPK